MIQSLYRIGKEISQDRDEWADIISFPKISVKDSSKKLLTLKLVFDIDNKEVVVSESNLYPFENEYATLKRLNNIKIQGGNNKSIYITAEEGKPALIAKTFFGKIDSKGNLPTEGEFLQAINGVTPDLAETQFAEVLKAIFPLKEAFDAKILNEKGVYKTDKIKEELNLGNSNKLILITTSVKWSELGEEVVDCGDLKGYTTFLERKYFAEKKKGKNKLCYATGEVRDDVKEAGFTGRYNINKTFVKTTQNYATNFNKKSYAKNYQISQETETFLDRGSEFILNNCRVSIADVSHAVIPQFFQQEDLELENLQVITKKTDLIFQLSTLEDFSTYMEDAAEHDSFLRLTFIAIDSDGNYFKVANQIRDVSSFHFEQIIKTFKSASKYFQPWLGDKYAFNLGSMYYALPVRSDKENINRALQLFAAILEQRQIDEDRLYKFFTDLVLCHYYKRYRGYKNILENSNLDFAIKDAVFKYSAFIHSLRQLKLLKITDMSTGTTVQNTNEEIKIFFEKMQYRDDEQALFYLGRMLNQTAYLQEQKGNKKNVLDKLNYNGMDAQTIYRLSTDLFDKARQYNATDKIKWNFAKFNELFKINDWKMNPQKSLFFILAGYTFGIKSNSQTNTSSSTETQNN